MAQSVFFTIVFVLDLARNGELQSRISKMGSLSVECSRYYAAQIVDALDYMHGKGVIHRSVPLPTLHFLPHPPNAATSNLRTSYSTITSG
jgi:serine/threonine protein kinase